MSGVFLELGAPVEGLCHMLRYMVPIIPNDNGNFNPNFLGRLYDSMRQMAGSINHGLIYTDYRQAFFLVIIL